MDPNIEFQINHVKFQTKRKTLPKCHFYAINLHGKHIKSYIQHYNWNQGIFLGENFLVLYPIQHLFISSNASCIHIKPQGIQVYKVDSLFFTDFFPYDSANYQKPHLKTKQ